MYKKVIKLIIFVMLFSTNPLFSEVLNIAISFEESAALYQRTGILFNEIEALIEGVEFEFTSLPFLRAKNELISGNVDGDFARFRKVYEPYDNVLIIDHPILNVNYNGFHKKEFNYTGIESLKNIKIAILRGNVVMATFIDDNDLEAIYVNKSDQGLKMVNSGRVDFFITSFQTYYSLPISDRYEDSIQITEPLFSEGLYLFLNEKHSKYVPELKKAMKQLSDSGRIKEIYTFN